jgi:CheY-like chemotaxis protein
LALPSALTSRKGAGPHAPIVVMTAARDAPARAAELGAEGVLAKPFDLDELYRVVGEHAA